MKVSIIIPVYNVSTYIERCLDSVRNQSYNNLEIIIVDDGSTDNSMEIVTRYVKQYNLSNTKILSHTHNKGLSAARNTGLKVATGDYVYFLDSDDSLTLDCLSNLVPFAKTLCCDFVIGNYIIESYSDNDREYPALTQRTGLLLNNKEIFRSYSKGQWYMMAWNKLCNREFLLTNNMLFNEGILHEDVIWSFKLACKASSMYIIEKATYIYRIHPASIMTGTSIGYDVNQYINAFKEITRFVINEGRKIGKDEYYILEGRKNALLLSLLQKKEYGLYTQHYKEIYKMPIMSPWTAFKKGMIGIKYLMRDIHYLLPEKMGLLYKRFFYNIYYKWRNKQIEGSLW